jgi:hypothetical protein
LSFPNCAKPFGNLVANQQVMGGVLLLGKLQIGSHRAQQHSNAALPVWKSAQLRSEPARQWLRRRRRKLLWAAGISIAVALLIDFASAKGVLWQVE